MAAVISPVTGTRTEVKDGYVFARGTTGVFKAIFTSDERPVTVDTGTFPQAKILNPVFLNTNGTPLPQIIATLNGSIVPGQLFEYQFSWEIPIGQTPIDEYVVSYQGTVGNITYNFGDEFFTVSNGQGMVGMQVPFYATCTDVRIKKFNIDDYLPVWTKGEGTESLYLRNNIIEAHLRDATSRLREELNLAGQRGNTENNRLFCIYYTIWSIMLASRGEDGSSVADQNIIFWRTEWERILAQEKRKHGVMQGMPLGRG